MMRSKLVNTNSLDIRIYGIIEGTKTPYKFPALLRTAGERSTYWRYVDMPKYTIEKQIQLFHSRTDKSAGASECWIWRAGRNKKGYGIMRWRKKMTLAHRIAYELAYGEIPQALQVLHNCPNGDNPSCVNPAHLRLGTNADNVADRVRKGRSKPRRGEQHGRAKLNTEQVRNIRSLYAEGNLSQRQIGELYGVTQEQIGYIVNRKNWKDV